jgi:hypothetical protein
MSDDVSGLRTWMQQSLADPGDNIAKSVSDVSANENGTYDEPISSIILARLMGLWIAEQS